MCWMAEFVMKGIVALLLVACSQGDLQALIGGTRALYTLSPRNLIACH